jgi:tetratricopeptide (TPR) repeat protein
MPCEPRNHSDDSQVIFGRWPGWLSLVLATVVGLTLPGCGGGDESGGDATASSSSPELIEQVEEMLTEIDQLVVTAKSTGAERYKATDLKAAIKLVDRAKEQLEDGNAKKARTTARSAKRKLESVVEETETLAGKMKAVETKVAQYATKLAEVKALGGETSGSDMEGAVRSYEKAMSYIESGKASSAGKYLGYAISDLDRVIEQFNANAKNKTSADAEKTLMAEKRQLAIDAGAEEKALRDLEYARDRERLGDQAYESSDFDSAIRHFRDAKTGYVGALETARREDSAIAIGTNNGAPDGGNGGQDGEVPGVDQIDIPDIGTGGDLDLSTDLASLFSGAAEYDSAKGSLRLNWADGSELQHDMTRLLGDPSHTHFEGDEGVGQGQDGAYVLAGNTTGYWTVNASFKDGVRIRAKVLFQLLIDKPNFEILLMSDGAQDFYAASYGAHAKIYKNGLPVGNMSSPLAAYKKSPKDWVQKREPYEFEFIYYKRGDDKGVLEAKINGETTVKLKTDRYRKGFPGFRWTDTKFIIQELEISGIVDEEWAKSELKKVADGTRGESTEDDFDF